MVSCKELTSLVKLRHGISFDLSVFLFERKSFFAIKLIKLEREKSSVRLRYCILI